MLEYFHESKFAWESIIDTYSNIIAELLLREPEQLRNVLTEMSKKRFPKLSLQMEKSEENLFWPTEIQMEKIKLNQIHDMMEYIK